MENKYQKYIIGFGGQLYTVPELSLVLNVSKRRLYRFANSMNKDRKEYADLQCIKDSITVITRSHD